MSTIESRLERIEQLLVRLAGREAPSILSVEHVARLTGRAPETVRSWLRRGLLQGTRVRGRGTEEWCIRAEDLARFQGEAPANLRPDAPLTQQGS